MTRKRVVLVKGDIPCDVLFIGEAPGRSEDALGKPFKGPAGQNLDKWIGIANPGTLRLAFTNLIGCIPKRGGQKDAPKAAEIKECAPRLRELVIIARPKMIVCVGDLAEKWWPKVQSKRQEDIPWVHITHPSNIMRMTVANKGMAIQKVCVRLADAFEETHTL